MMKQVDAYLENQLDEAVESLRKLIRFASVREPALENMPYGKPTYDALEYALKLAESMGFETKNYDGYAGRIEWGEGPKLGIFCHLDVVPAGLGWDYDPFGAEEVDGKIYGRGTMDDKGPTISTLYVLKTLKDLGYQPPCKIQVLLGCCEEQDWSCLKYYASKEPLPDFGFSPDADYPLAYSEKGILQCYFKKEHKSELRVNCNGSINVVPGVAYAQIPAKYLEGATVPETLEVEYDADTAKLTMNGLGGHAAHPELAKNSMLMLMEFFKTLPLPQEDLDEVNFILDKLTHMYGAGLGFAVFPEEGDCTSMAPTIAVWDGETITLGQDLRHPPVLTEEEVLGRMKDQLGQNGYTLDRHSYRPAHIMAPDSTMVESLMDIFRRRSGHMDAKPFAFSGGTYARFIPKAVAFGCNPYKVPTRAHMPNEFISRDEMLFDMQCIAEAIVTLCEKREAILSE